MNNLNGETTPDISDRQVSVAGRVKQFLPPDCNPYQSGVDSREALIALNLIDHVGPDRARLPIEHFG